MPLLASSITCVSGTCTGPTGTYYVTDGLNNYLAIIQGLNVAVKPTGPATNGPLDNQFAIAVTGTVDIQSRFAGGTGAQYDLAGNPTGVLYPQAAEYEFADDGTTDGTHNYFMLYSANLVFQAGLDWSNPTPVFGVGGGAALGITYDPANSSFWVNDLNDNGVADYSPSGVLLSSFNGVGTVGHSSLAYDASDGTLWMNVSYTNEFQQYTTGGVLLQDLIYNDLSAGALNDLVGQPYFLGGEIAATPEPGTLMLLSSGFGGLLLKLRRRKV